MRTRVPIPMYMCASGVGMGLPYACPLAAFGKPGR